MRFPLLPVLALAALLAGPARAADSWTVTTVRVPTEVIDPDLETRGGLAVRGLNDAGQWVGTFGERNATIWGMPHGVAYDLPGYADLAGPGSLGRDITGTMRIGLIEASRYVDPNFRYLDLRPAQNSDFNALATTPNAVNAQGLVVGSIGADAFNAQPLTAFAYDSQNGQMQLLQVPGAISSVANGVNAQGQIVGTYVDGQNVSHGFLWSGQGFATLDDPSAGRYLSTTVTGINDLGDIVGWFDNPATNQVTSFIYRKGQFFDFTAQGRATFASGINDAGTVVGWVNGSGERMGFVYAGGSSQILDLSAGDSSTYLYAINNNGVIGGSVGDLGVLVSSVPEPANGLLLMAGLALLAPSSRRRHRRQRLGRS